MEEIRIPKERISVLIGKYGKEKKELEKATNTKIEIDTKDNIVTIRSDDSINLFNAKPIIKAIARGFNPDIAELLLDEDYILEIIDIQDFSGKSKKKFIRLKSRCIGEDGKARKNVEDMTNTNISIYGKTVSIIGKINDVGIARSAIEELLRGAPHGNVYRRIDVRKRSNKDNSIES